MNRATAIPSPPSQSATTSRSSRPPPRACSRAIGPLSGERLGLELLIALLLGIPALLWGARRGTIRARGRAGTTERGAPRRHERDGPRAHGAGSGRRGSRRLAASAAHPRAVAAGLIIWMLTGIVLFSHMIRLHPRYVEGFTPAVAAMLGIGVAWVARRRAARAAPGAAGRRRSRSPSTTPSACCTGARATWWIALLGALGAIAFALLARLPALALARRARWLAPAGVIGDDARGGARDRREGGPHRDPRPRQRRRLRRRAADAKSSTCSAPTCARTRTARTTRSRPSRRPQIGSLIVQDARPVLVLTTYNARVFTIGREARSG